MTLLIGTDDGVFRTECCPFEAGDLESVLDGRTTSVRSGTGSTVYATTDEDCYRSDDDGRSWEPLRVPGDDRHVWSVLDTPDALFVGTNDPALYRSTDGGASWSESSGFADLPSRSLWQSPVDPDRARVRTLESDPAESSRVVAGIEAGGVHVGDDEIDEWTDRRSASPDDVHQILAVGADEYLLAAGYLGIDGEETVSIPGGLHRTTDGGESWTRLDADSEHAYIRRVLVHGDTIYYGGSRTGPGSWREEGGTDSALFESSDGGSTFERVSYPGEPRELVLAWTVLDGRVVGGTGGFVGDDDRGRLIGKVEGGGWETVGTVPEDVRALESV